MRARIGLVVLALAGVLAAPAAAAPEPRLVEDHAGPASSDGRYLWHPVYPSASYQRASPVRLIDSRKGTTQTVTPPAGCELQLVPSIRRGHLVCETAPRSRILELDTGTVEPTGADACQPPRDQSPSGGRFGEARFGQLGRHWIHGVYQAGDNGRGVPVLLSIYYNWRTGECRRSERRSDPSRDIDRAELPVRRRPSCARPGTPFVAIDSLGLPDDPLDLRLCRERRTVSVRCRAYCELQTARNGIIAWSEGQVAKVQIVATGRRYGWRFADHDRASGYATVHSHLLGRTLYVSAGQRDPGHFRLYAVDLPG